MAFADLQRALSDRFGASILKVRAPSADQEAMLWVESSILESVASFLRREAQPSFVALEDCFVFELEGSAVVSYALESDQDRLLLRVATQMRDADAWLELPSLRVFWPNLEIHEERLGELWGIRFQGAPAARWTRSMPEGWIGFPMRKAYLFPTEFNEIPHQRPIGRTNPDEHGVGGMA